MRSGDRVPSTGVARSRLARTGWFVGGWSAVAVGGIGIVVPGLPTTVFFVIACACFGRSSPRFEQWVLDLPRIGPLVRDHRAGLGMSSRAKRTAIATMWGAISLSVVLVSGRWWLAAVVVAAGLVGTWYILRRVPRREVEVARREALLVEGT